MYNAYNTKDVKKKLPPPVFNPNLKTHKIKMNSHWLLCGPTGAGKTNAVWSYLGQMDNCFSHIYVFTNDSDEPIYNALRDKLGEHITFQSISKVPTTKQFKDDKVEGEVLIIFDDFICEGKHTIERLTSYAIQMRKQNCTCMYLTQSFFSCPPKLRGQISYLALLSMTDKKNVSLIASSLATSIELPVVKHIMQNATKEALNVCIINLKSCPLNEKFRRNFMDFYTVVDDDGNELPISRIPLYKGSGVLN